MLGNGAVKELHWKGSLCVYFLDWVYEILGANALQLSKRLRWRFRAFILTGSGGIMHFLLAELINYISGFRLLALQIAPQGHFLSALISELNPFLRILVNASILKLPLPQNSRTFTAVFRGLSRRLQQEEEGQGGGCGGTSHASQGCSSRVFLRDWLPVLSAETDWFALTRLSRHCPEYLAYEDCSRRAKEAYEGEIESNDDYVPVGVRVACIDRAAC